MWAYLSIFISLLHLGEATVIILTTVPLLCGIYVFSIPPACRPSLIKEVDTGCFTLLHNLSVCFAHGGERGFDDCIRVGWRITLPWPGSNPTQGVVTGFPEQHANHRAAVPGSGVGSSGACSAVEESKWGGGGGRNKRKKWRHIQ